MPPQVLTFHITHKDGHRIPVVIYDTHLGRAVSDDILGGRAYPQIPFIENVKTVLDVGANMGLSAIWFSMLYPGSRIVAAEPAPQTFALLAENAKHWRGIEPHAVGLHATAGEAPLFLGDVDGMTHSIGHYVHNSGRSTPIVLEDALAFLQARNIETIDVLKLDTEGCERPILARIQSRLPEIRVIYVEYHSDDDRRWIDGLLASTHLLHAGRVLHPHRGELCYVARTAYPSEGERDQHEIRTLQL